jgi:hypothetical protein
VPIHISGCVWVERLELEITLLTDVSEAIADLVIITWGALPKHLFVAKLLLEALRTPERLLALELSWSLGHKLMRSLLHRSKRS